jgi:ribosomal protein S18 acetylase RimI-like enzyme
MWRRELAWDVTETWRPLEAARAAGTLPGFIARDARGRVTGWTWFLRHHGWVQVGALVASEAEASAALLEAVLASTGMRTSQGLAICVRDAAPGLLDALDAHGVAHAHYRYLSRPLQHGNPAATSSAGIRAWTTGDIPAAAQLCARAYPSIDDVRAFAPGGTLAEWRDYLAGLLAGSCGRFLFDASAVAGSHARTITGTVAGRVDGAVDGAPDAALAGAIVTTDLGMGTAHIAQVAVDPDVAGRGLGTALVQRACAVAASIGFARVTLLVSDANHRASSIYARLGFQGRATFVVARAAQPRLSTSVALATGGASTRR